MTTAIEIRNRTYQLSSISKLGIPLVLSKLVLFARITLGESCCFETLKRCLGELNDGALIEPYTLGRQDSWSVLFVLYCHTLVSLIDGS